MPYKGSAMRYSLAIAVSLLAAPGAADTGLIDRVADLDLVPCELSALSCTTLTLPLDHRANDPSKTIDITFALSFASVESRGILFFFVGGPGGSGLASADSYLPSFDEKLVQYTDIVFVDQRGTGPDHGLACPVAQSVFDTAPADLADPEAMLAAAKTFVRDCTQEMDADDLLPFVDSDQAIRDVEAFRQAIGAPKVWLYGESYGTQFAQGYATLYPEAVRGVILDGVVDLNLDAEGFYASYTKAAESILERTFAACAEDAACRRDMPGDAAAVYDTLTERLNQSPVTVPLTLANGRQVDRQLTLGMVQNNAFYALYSPADRSVFLRALAAAGRGNLVPMLQLSYSNLFIDPETEIGMEDPGWFGAAYFAITCTDYDSGQGSPDDRAAAILDEARAFAPTAPRLSRAYYLERIVCAYWPYQGPATRPAPFAGGDYPTVILNSDADPITPITMAYSVLDSAANSYAILMQNGPHVIWGWGLGCPDVALRDLLYEGTLPPVREQHCTQPLLDGYTGLTLTQASDMKDPVKIAEAVEVEIYQSLPLGAWDWVDPFTVGCDHGGIITASYDDRTAEARYQFEDCKFWPDLSLSGVAAIANSGEESDSYVLNATVSGRHSGQIAYSYNYAAETWSLSGTWDGQPTGLTRLSP
ncbi:MAG: hypothetical protein B7Z10_01155 [Rhodobacterales bacterium 32-66-7]|nr:MAG: hypothetical protein B7Z10_01155 [Rhodobacterales bacterium 32-66-7]